MKIYMPTNKCQLIVYPNSLGNNLSDLNYILETYFRDIIGGVHILPFYPSSADRGFAPITYDTVDSQFGSWQDIHKIADKFEIMVDFMANHISKQSIYFQDFLEKGHSSEYADMFLPTTKLAPDGNISTEDIRKIYTRKPRAPFVEVLGKDGTKHIIWSTFEEEQIDVDIYSAVTRRVFEHYLDFLCQQNIKYMRIDAFAYVTKQLGTHSFFLEPSVWEVLDWIKDKVSSYGVTILPEIHEHYSIQKSIQEKGFWVYDFSLPMLCLEAIFHNNAINLKYWLSICPRNQFTTLDTHDGIGVVDVADLLSEEQIQKTAEQISIRGGNLNEGFSNNAEYQNVDIYQINCTYYSALGEDDNSYIVARTIQIFTPGIPQIYYVGLLAGKNDVELLEQTKVGRDINRHFYTLDEIKENIQKPVVQRLFNLMKFRNNCEAFLGELTILESENDILHLRWDYNDIYAIAYIDLTNYIAQIEHNNPQGEVVYFNA
jgi:sucrose phosphorylase